MGDGSGIGRRFTSIELFTGAGGLARALDETGYVDHRLAVEIDRRACETLRLNGARDVSSGLNVCTSDSQAGSNWPLYEGDIRDVDFASLAGSIDIVAGGVPCQPWSLGGIHRGFDDPRNLWPELFRTVRETRPKVVIAENVKGLLRASFKPYYEYILDSLAAPFDEPIEGEDWRDHHQRLLKIKNRGLGPAHDRYVVKYQLVNAADYGVPQQRWRVFVVAFRGDLGLEDWEFPTETHSEQALRAAKSDGSYWQEHGLSMPPGQLSLPRTDGRLRWRTLRDAVAGLPEPLGHKVQHPEWIDHYGWEGAREYPGHTPSVLDLPAKTIKAGVHGVPGGETVMRLDDGAIRYMTVREAARVMTFPDNWQLAGPRGEQMRQLGNAVPVALGRTIASSVVEALCSVHAPHPKWRDDPLCDAEWKAASGRSIADARQEQDEAAGGASARLIRLPDGTVRTGSIELKPNRKGRRVYANLRFTSNGRTNCLYVGEVGEASRKANLRAAWQLAATRGLLDLSQPSDAP